MRFAVFAATSVAAMLVATPAQAVVTIAFTQQTTGVTVDVSGSIDNSSFVYRTSNSTGLSYLQSQTGVVSIIGSAHDIFVLPAGTLRAYGPSLSTVRGTSLGGAFGLTRNGGINDFLILPQGYVAGSALSASAVFTGATFASLNVTPVDFTESLGGGQTIAFVFRTAAVTGPVPEPATWAMMIAGFGLVGGALRRRRVAVSFG